MKTIATATLALVLSATTVPALADTIHESHPNYTNSLEFYNLQPAAPRLVETRNSVQDTRQERTREVGSIAIDPVLDPTIITRTRR